MFVVQMCAIYYHIFSGKVIHCNCIAIETCTSCCCINIIYYYKNNLLVTFSVINIFEYNKDSQT